MGVFKRQRLEWRSGAGNNRMISTTIKQRVFAMWPTLLFIGLVVFGLPALAYFGQGKLIFPATRNIYRTPADVPFNWDYEDVYVAVGDEKSHAWFIPLENARATVLFSHGNAGNIADRLESVQIFRRLGMSVLLYDYGGYGKSSGRPSESRVYADVAAMWDYLVEERGLLPQEIIIFGRSLGGAAAAHLGAQVESAAVVLESTFSSIPDVVRDMMPLGGVLARGVRHHFPSIEKVKDIRSPLLIIHSVDDTLIPYAHGRRLYDTASAPKYFLDIRGDHNDGFILSLDIYLDGWERFIDAHLEKQPLSR